MKFFIISFLLTFFIGYKGLFCEVRTIHVVVALCDNEHQGVVPVPEIFGNGDDPANNLYWGAYYGVKAFFKRSPSWELITTQENPKEAVLEKCIFRHKTADVYLIADAYRGKEIKKAIVDFLESASGNKQEKVEFECNSENVELEIASKSDLLAYIGHNGLMDFTLDSFPEHKDTIIRDVMIVACISETYFMDAIKKAGANPLVWTTGLLAAEAYPLEGAIAGWILNESGEQIRTRAAKAYHKYQKCGLKAAKKLFVTGF